MIKLNLLPKELKTLQTRKSGIDIYSIVKNANIIPIVVAVFLFLVFAHGFLAWFVISQKAGLRKLQLECELLVPGQKKAQALKTKVLALDEKVTVIEDLSEGGVFWPKKLYDLSSAMVDGVWLDLLYLKLQTDREEEPVTAAVTPGAAPVAAQIKIVMRQILVLEGRAVSSNDIDETAVVGRFIKSLKEHKDFFNDFEDIKLFSVERETVGDIEVMNFVINCYFKKENKYFEKLNG
ncbi:MAG: hypothetical protein ABIB11_04465 [Candidatus Omnitrophota bacterium]